MSNSTHYTDMARARAALTYVSPVDRETWLHIGMAIKSAFGDDGFDMWNTWSQQADSFNGKDALDVWKSIGAGGKVRLGTLFKHAKDNGWRDNGMYQKPTPEGLDQRRRMAEEQAAKEKTEIARKRAEAAKKAAEILKVATPASADHPYLLRKEGDPVDTLLEIDAARVKSITKYAPKSDGELLTGRLLIAAVKKDGKLSTLEFIDEQGRKSALRGGAKAGGYWATGRLPDGNGNGLTLLLGEGVVTVLSAGKATGHLAIAALSSGNLLAVAEAMHELYPAAMIVVVVY